MRTGKLRHRVALQSYTVAKNTFGEDIKTWATYATVWGQVSPLTGKELFNAQQANSEISVNVWIRNNTTVAVEHRCLFDSRYFEINAIINPEERNNRIQLQCKETT